MRVVLGAIDSTAAARPVLGTTKMVAALFGATPVAFHVRENGLETARAAAHAAGIELEIASGPVAEGLLAAAGRPDVAGMVVGARGTPGGPRPAGHAALSLIAAAEKPVVVVPPTAYPPASLHRILVALDGTAASAAALRGTLEIAERRGIDVALLHVHPDAGVPAFEEQGHHEHEAWSREFMERWDPGGAGHSTLELRTGPPERHLVGSALDARADLIALTWSGTLAPGHAAVVREALSSSSVPVLLVPMPPDR